MKWNAYAAALYAWDVEIDHVLIAVDDLAFAARDMAERHGLDSIEGGRHPGWGTANRIVPLGESYLELVAVVDEAEASKSVFGRWVASGATTSGRPIGWAVRTGEIEDVGRRLGLDVRAGSRVTPSGERLQWRTAGVEQAVAEGSLPFFIEWGAGTPFPGRARGTHSTDPPALAQIVIQGDADRLADWLDGATLPIVVRPGRPRLAGIVISRAAGKIVLGTNPPG